MCNAVLPSTAWSLPQPLCWMGNQCTCCLWDIVCIKSKTHIKYKYDADGTIQQKNLLYLLDMAGHISFTEFFKPQIIPEWKDWCLWDMSCNFQDRKFSVRRGCLERHPFSTMCVKLRALSFITIRILCFCAQFLPHFFLISWDYYRYWVIQIKQVI